LPKASLDAAEVVRKIALAEAVDSETRVVTQKE